MKRKFVLFCLLCTFAAKSLIAKNDPGNTAAYNTVINDYISCHMSADGKKLNRLLHDDASFKIPRGEKVMVQNKSNLVAQMRREAGIQQNCASDYELLAESDALVIARVDFTYGSTTQSNYLIIEKNADKEWKITQVCKFFKDPQKNSSPVTANNPL
ncbi:hypothetical protein DJ568_10810 [Mucilaginibacter hurinus]|uniref:Nuclear transport factor 2 family protein n=1 Tax=Mucilaginibacter hurinus TaxID=2201324 RepID=A0A367GQ10_9SPHI|nr:nuclear transport factor 2 family protein [Mucilaginibacter hurinus]RCH54956.1 hypothetical protein DJ568_10810 [Mucilaginibacter hurinus]